MRHLTFLALIICSFEISAQTKVQLSGTYIGEIKLRGYQFPMGSFYTFSPYIITFNDDGTLSQGEINDDGKSTNVESVPFQIDGEIFTYEAGGDYGHSRIHFASLQGELIKMSVVAMRPDEPMDYGFMEELSFDTTYSYFRKSSLSSIENGIDPSDSIFEDSIGLYNYYKWKKINAVHSRTNEEILREDWGVDSIIYGLGSGDGMLSARKGDSKKWGIFQCYSGICDEFVPMEYDSVRSFEQNEWFTAVYNNGKVGFYLATWSFGDDAKQTVPCEYDAYKIVGTNDYSNPNPYLAVKKNGKWAWLNWRNNQLMSDWVDNRMALPVPNY